MNPNTQKDTIYIDIDEDITGIIENVIDSDKKIVALVLPKRASTLQSVVNMRLLKQKADDAKKKIVLITSETSLLPLAGLAGVHVAKTLQSKPVVPASPEVSDGPITVDENDTDDLDATKPIGVLAGLPDEDTIELDNSDSDVKSEAEKPKKADKKLKVPNFNSFRLRLFIGLGLLLLLIGGWFVAFKVLPTAEIVVKTDTSEVTSQLTVVARPGLDEANAEQSLIPAERKQVRVTDSESTPTTGEKDEGTPANGTVTLTNCRDSEGSVTIPAGTGISSGNLTFITQEAVTLPASIFGGGSSRPCLSSSRDVDVAAQSAGEQFNLPPDRTFTVAGFSNVTGENEDAFSGGTSRVVKVVTAEDIETARNRALDRMREAVRTELAEEFQTDSLYALEEAITTEGEPAVTSSPNVDAEATEVTVNVTVTFVMVGFDEKDIEQLIEDDIRDQIDTSRQAITNYGLETADIRVLIQEPNGDVRFSVNTNVVAGPELDEDMIRQEVIGKKKGEAVSSLEGQPGVSEVTIEYSPFWVYSTPSNPNKIDVRIEQVDNGSAEE